MRAPLSFEARPAVGRLQRRLLVAPTMALLLATLAMPARAGDAAPSACNAIREPWLILSNLDKEGRGRVMLRGQLPDTVLSGLPPGGEGELRIEDLGSANGPLFTMATTAPAEKGACGRFHTERGRALRRVPNLGDGCTVTRQQARLRIANGLSHGAAGSFVLRVRGESLSLPLGALRVTFVFGSGEEGCSRWTFAREDCSLENGDTALICGPPASESETGCKRTGCSAQLCSEEDIATTCEFRPEYACYREAACEPQDAGACGWTPSEDLARCLAETRGPPMPPPVPGVPRTAWFSCDSDADCIVYPGLDCCGCTSGGGPEVAIHRDAKDEVDAYRLCPDVGCPAEYLCRDGRAAVCRAGRCAIE